MTTEINSTENCQVCGSNKSSKFCDSCKKETLSDHKVTVMETMSLIERMKGQIREREGVAPHIEFTSKSMDSLDKIKHPKGVHQLLSVNRKENWYDQVVTDLNTGNVTHDEYMPLTDHK